MRQERPLANMLLTYNKEQGLILWLHHQDALKVRAIRLELQYEVDCILADRHTGPGFLRTYSEHWVRRFLKRHNVFKLHSENPKEIERQAAEDPDALAMWFQE
jgi:hypothetical protein